jgi:large subunit ribosomal protein L32
MLKSNSCLTREGCKGYNLNVANLTNEEGGAENGSTQEENIKAKRNSRQAANMKMSEPGLSICPQCHEPKLPHRVCPNCNYYDGKEVISSEK